MFYMSVTKEVIHIESQAHNWQKQSDVVTHDDVIDAYIAGKEVGRNLEEKLRRDKFESNLKKATEVSEQLFNKIEATGATLKVIHLRADSITSFCGLFVVDPEDFLKDEFRQAFILAREAKLENEDDTFEISFLFTPYSPHLSEQMLFSDGYFIRYYGEEQRAI